MITRLGPSLDDALGDLFAHGYTPTVRAYTRAIGRDVTAVTAFADALCAASLDRGGLPSLGNERQAMLSSVARELSLLDARLASDPDAPAVGLMVVSYVHGALLLGGCFDDAGVLAPLFTRHDLTDDPVMDFAALACTYNAVSFAVVDEAQALALGRSTARTLAGG